MKKFGGLVVLALTFLLLTSVTFSDGCYIPARAMKDYPSIPSQRAVVVHRDGVETLIIESALEGEGKEFGWVIPLPSRPTEFEAMTGGFIETLSQTVQPIVSHSQLGFFASIVLMAVVLIWFLLIVVVDRSEKPLITLLILVSFLVLISSMLMPALGVSKGVGKSGSSLEVDVVGSQEIGSYEVVVLEAEKANGLQEWLDVNGFARLEDDATDIVEDYISEGWCFVAAKLKREADGYSVPHPMSVKFASDKAIYPMRLTAMAKSDVYLELYVIAEYMADAKGMELEFCDTYKFDEAAEEDYFNDVTLVGYSCADRHASIGHLKAFDHMWDGCAVSRLAGTFGPDDMNEDIILKMSEVEPYRKHYYSYQGAGQSCVVSGILIWCVLVIFSSLRYGKRIREAGGRKFALMQIGLKSLVICVFIALSIFVSLDKVNIRGASKLPARWVKSFDSGRFRISIEEMAMSDYFKDMSVSEVREITEKYFQEEGKDNYHTSEKRKYEDSPGNFTVFEDKRGVVIRGYLAGGFPVDLVIDDL